MEEQLIYIAENNEGEQFFIKKAFSGIDGKRRLCFFKNGYELLAALTAKSLPDFILMDLDMPEMNGLETLYILKKIAQWQDIPVIVFSADYSEKEVDACLECGVRAFFSKPLNMMDYSEILKSVITENV